MKAFIERARRCEDRRKKDHRAGEGRTGLHKSNDNKILRKPECGCHRCCRGSKTAPHPPRVSSFIEDGQLHRCRPNALRAECQFKTYNHSLTSAVPYSRPSNGRVESLLDQLKTSSATMLLGSLLMRQLALCAPLSGGPPASRSHCEVEAESLD